MDAHTEPQFARAALITIDTQRDTLDGAAFEIPGTSQALPAMRRLTAAFRAAGRPIVHVVRIYEADGSNAEPARRALLTGARRALIRDTAGCQLAEELLPDRQVELDPELLLVGELQPLGPDEVAMYKPRWGAFYRTPLEEHLRRHNITTLVFAGCNFPNCPRTSIYEASERDFRIVLANDAISGLYERGARELENIGVCVMSADAVVNALHPGDDEPQPNDRQRDQEDRRVEHVPLRPAHVPDD